MFLRRHAPAQSRRGVILLVVLSLLTLFAVVGISFVLYADAEAEASRIFREAAANPTVPDMDPEQALALVMAQLVYGVPDDASGVFSALRGHDFARLIYGLNDGNPPNNTHAYNGTGPLHYTNTLFGQPVDDFTMVNYQFFQTDGFLRDPERYESPPRAGLAAARGPYTGGANAPYTYPDRNNMLLAAMKADGTLLAVSGNRPYLFNPSPLAFNDTTNNPNWTNNIGKYLTLRPRPADHITQTAATNAGLTWPLDFDKINSNPAQKVILNNLIAQLQAQGKLFPYPEDAIGDVKNLIGFPGGNDSIWTDIGAPVMTASNGVKYKMMVAPLILDMDGRVNLNAHGNIRGVVAGSSPVQRTHASNQGACKTEINLSMVLNGDNPAAPTEWVNLFQGVSQKNLRGKYGAGQPVGVIPLFPTKIPFYTALDLDGCNENPGPAQYTPTGKMILPRASGTPTFGFPVFPPGYGSGSAAEWANIPLLYNVFNPYAGPPPDRAFAWSEMEALLRHSGTNSPALTSDLQRLLPQNLGAGAAALRIRNMVTTHSFHLDRPAVTPWIWDPTNAATVYGFDPTKQVYPQGAPINFPTIPPGGPPPTPPATATTPFSDFDSGWRASLGPTLLKGLNKVQLNRNLTDYYDTTAGTPFPANLQLDPMRFAQAVKDRQNLAQDIFIALQEATGVYVANIKTVANPAGTIIAPAPPNALQKLGDAQFEALRWLAQLSVNIVDYIDFDDFITPFPWFIDTDNSVVHFVYGTEQPRAVVNEIYTEVQNDPADPNGLKNFNVNFWLELLNTMSIDPQLIENGNVRINMPAKVTGRPTDYPVYQIAISQNPKIKPPISYLRQAWNTKGDPDPATVLTQVTDYSKAQPGPVMKPLVTAGTADANVILPNDKGAYGDMTAASAGGKYNGFNNGFYVMSPADPASGNPIPFQDAADPSTPVPTLAVPTVPANAVAMTPRTGLTVQIPAATTFPFDPLLNPAPDYTVVFQRLACPNMPPDSNPASATYNPYITVDYVEHVKVNDGVVNSTQAGHTRTQVDFRNSMGRYEPYAASADKLILRDQAPNPALPKQPQTTFFRHNGVKNTPPPAATDKGPAPGNVPQTISVPFDWMTHLDRKLVSPIELLQISAFKPHELTQMFLQPNATGGIQKFAHRAPWFDEDLVGSPAPAPSHRLYRFFEFVETPDTAWGVPFGGRYPGKININTVWEPEIFRALCAASSSNYFQQEPPPGTWPPLMAPTDDVDRVFYNLLAKRTPGLITGSGLSQTDLPFLPMSNGTYPQVPTTDPQFRTNQGIDNTFFQRTVVGATVGSVFDAQIQQSNPPVVPDPLQQTTSHPYIQKALLNKIYNHLTTRSNVFGVWFTVGFFEVTDDTTRPVKLGAEIGKAEGRTIRHRMFALVDRSNLQVSPSGLVGNAVQTQPTTDPTLWTVSVPVSKLQDLRTNTVWSPQQGMVISVNGNGAVVGPTVGTPVLPQNSEEDVVILDQPTVALGNVSFHVRLNLTYPLNIPPPGANTIPNLFMSCYGNPGPWTKYDPRQDNQVVPYFSIID